MMMTEIAIPDEGDPIRTNNSISSRRGGEAGDEPRIGGLRHREVSDSSERSGEAHAEAHPACTVPGSEPSFRNV